MVEEIKVSIVVPVYNVENYLRECLDSLVNQTLKDIEIICVNDGSKDSSPQILEEYAKKDKRVKVFHQENQGVSIARNKGISIAKGKYLTFCDCDDWIDLETCKILYKTIEERKSDIILFSYYNFHNKITITKDKRLEEIASIACDGNITFKDYYKELFETPLLSCGKLYKTEFIHKNKILFPLKISCSEDRVFSIKAFIDADKISVLDLPLYYYRLNANQSLTKNSKNTVAHTYEVKNVIKKYIYSSDKITNKDEIYEFCLHDTVDVMLYHWSSIYNIGFKKTNIKYMKKIEKDYRPFANNSERDVKMYKRLKDSIKEYNNLFFNKLTQPFYEIEHRHDRIAFYLFEKQVFNFYIGFLRNDLLRIKYFKNLLKLRLLSKIRKIKVAFWYHEPEKWSSIKSLYKEFEKSEYFEPVVYLTCPSRARQNISQKDLLELNSKFLDSQNVRYVKLYDIKQSKFLSIKDFKADIIFYQVPWDIPYNQNPLVATKFALCCYVPYCVYSLKSYVNYFTGFHGRMWKYFVETELHKKEYEKEYRAKNCVVVGSSKFDNYKTLNMDNIEKLKQEKNKKTIIYAPHHSIEDYSIHKMGTFKENGDFILDFAKKHQEFNWIFRPHSALADRLLTLGLKSQKEINEYYSEWEKIGKISGSEDDYYEKFMLSDCLITDSISFLSEYLPVNKPVLHLRCEKQAQPFNDLLQKIITGYYQIYNNEEFEKVFNEVMINGNDYLKEKRSENIKYLMIDENKTTAQKIVEYIKKELRIK